MHSWVGKLFGVTPSRIKRVKAMEHALTAKAENLPYELVGRDVLLLLPLERCKNWTLGFEAGSKAISETGEAAQLRWANSRAYLIPIFESEEALERFVVEHRKYFIQSFVQRYLPRSAWPWVPSEDEFPEWFEYRVIGGPWDMEASKLSKAPDVCVGLLEEL